VAQPHQPEKLRMCIDTRKLNVQTIKGVYRGVLVYLNDILICAKTQEEHDNCHSRFYKS
jgi:hypothetical protein